MTANHDSPRHRSWTRCLRTIPKTCGAWALAWPAPGHWLPWGRFEIPRPAAAAAKNAISEDALDQLFREARTHPAWLPEPVPVELLRKAYELARLAPTSANASPARFVFLIAWDTEFHEKLPKLFPHANMRSYFVGNQALIDETGFRNSSLQAAYFILAARSLGLDCGPMSGFDADKLNREFFPDGKWKVNLICNLGYGDQGKLYPRNPRLQFEEASLVV
jgi:3-hydroxypropanoate dehydrogenase